MGGTWTRVRRLYVRCSAPEWASWYTSNIGSAGGCRPKSKAKDKKRSKKSPKRKAKQTGADRGEVQEAQEGAVGGPRPPRHAAVAVDAASRPPGQAREAARRVFRTAQFEFWSLALLRWLK